MDGFYADQNSWSPSDVPDSVTETAQFDRFGNYSVGFDNGTTQSVGHLRATRGEVRLYGSGSSNAALQVAEDVLVEGASLQFHQDADPASVSLAVDGSVTVDSAGVLLFSETDFVAQSIFVHAGSNTSATELVLQDAATADLGDVTIASEGAGSFEGSLTLLDNVVASVADLDIATTGSPDRRGVTQLFSATLEQSPVGVTTVGSANGLGQAIFALIGSRFSGHDVTVRSSGVITSVGGELHVEDRLALDGGRLTASGASTLTLGDTASLLVQNGGEIELPVGLVSLTAGQTLTIDDASFHSEGSLAVQGGAVLAGPDATIDSLVELSDGSIVGSAGSVRFLGDVVHTGGEIAVAPGAEITFEGSYTGPGATGDGLVSFMGEISPGLSPGLARFDGDFFATSDSVLRVEIGGTATHESDRIEVRGDAIVEGVLSVELVDLGSGQFVPNAGDRFRLLSAAEIVGGFESYDLPELTPGLQWRLHSTGSAMELFVVNPTLGGDYNGDGFVDAADYSLWRDALDQTGSLLAADGNQDGAVDLLDYQVWREAYGSDLAIGDPIPEPTTGLLATASLACAFAQRRLHG